MIDPWLLLLAWVAVWSDGPVPDSVTDRPGFLLAVRAIALAEEWVGANESGPHSIGHARELREQLRHAPPLWVLRVLPSEQWLDEQVAFADGHIRWVVSQRELYGESWEPWERDARELRRGYWALGMALWVARSRCAVSEARSHLRDAERVFGRDAVEAGTFPPPVPVVRFNRVR